MKSFLNYSHVEEIKIIIIIIIIIIIAIDQKRNIDI